MSDSNVSMRKDHSLLPKPLYTTDWELATVTNVITFQAYLKTLGKCALQHRLANRQRGDYKRTRNASEPQSAAGSAQDFVQRKTPFTGSGRHAGYPLSCARSTTQGQILHATRVVSVLSWNLIQ